MHRRARHPLSGWLTIALAALLCAGILSGCAQAPALTKLELDAGKLPGKHPKLTAKQAKSCRSCHREQPAIRAK